MVTETINRSNNLGSQFPDSQVLDTPFSSPNPVNEAPLSLATMPELPVEPAPAARTTQGDVFTVNEQSPPEQTAANTELATKKPPFSKRLWDSLREPHALIERSDSNFTATHVAARALLDNATHIVGAPVSFVGNIGASLANIGRALTSAVVRNREELTEARGESTAMHFTSRASTNLKEAGKDILDLVNHAQAFVPNVVKTLFYGLGTTCDSGVSVLAAFGV